MTKGSRPTLRLHTVLHIDPRILDPWVQGHHEDPVLQDHPFLTNLLLSVKVFDGFILLKMSPLENSDHYCTKKKV